MTNVVFERTKVVLPNGGSQVSPQKKRGNLVMKPDKATMRKLILMRATALFYDPRTEDFDTCVRMLANEFEIPRVVAEDAMGYIVDAACAVSAQA
jgi:hypothetical protein